MAPDLNSFSVHGIDVSHYQGRVDWTALARNNIHFAFIKATDGVSAVDPQFHANWEGAKAAGMVCGAYHFLRPNEDAKAQGERFASLVTMDDTTLPPALDIEIADNAEPRAVEQAIIDWIGAVRKTVNVRPILYTSPAFWRDHVAANFQSYPLWLACYAPEPELPPFWPHWTFWQHSSGGRVAGIDTPVDLNVFHADLAALKTMCIGSAGAAMV